MKVRKPISEIGCVIFYISAVMICKVFFMELNYIQLTFAALN